MDEKEIPAADEQVLKEWTTPTLISEEIEQVTQGGSLTLASPGDDTWYRS